MLAIEKREFTCLGVNTPWRLQQMVNARGNISIKSRIQISEHECFLAQSALIVVGAHLLFSIAQPQLILLTPYPPHLFAAHGCIFLPLGFNFIAV
jgi:hypothetical protein